MENTVKERIKEFIKFKNISIRKFEKICNLSNGYVNGINQTIMPNKTSIINLKFPELNIGWLLTGKGEMLLSNINDSVPSPNESFINIDNLTKRIELQKKVRQFTETLLKRNEKKELTDAYFKIFTTIYLLKDYIDYYYIFHKMESILDEYFKNKVKTDFVMKEFKKSIKNLSDLYDIVKPYENILIEIYNKVSKFDDEHDHYLTVYDMDFEDILNQ